MLYNYKIFFLLSLPTFFLTQAAEPRHYLYNKIEKELSHNSYNKNSIIDSFITLEILRYGTQQIANRIATAINKRAYLKSGLDLPIPYLRIKIPICESMDDLIAPVLYPLIRSGYLGEKQGFFHTWRCDKQGNKVFKCYLNVYDLDRIETLRVNTHKVLLTLEKSWPIQNQDS